MFIYCYTVSTSLLSSPEMWYTEEWVCVCQLIQAASLKSVPNMVDNITLPCLAHPYVALLSTLVSMCYNGSFKEHKMWR